MAKLLRKTRHNPAAEENVHKLRVANRRLLMLHWILDHHSGFHSIKGRSKNLRKLCEVLGKQRELDMAIKDAKHYGLDTASLIHKRKNARRQTRSFLRLKRQMAILKDLKKMKQNLEKLNRKVQKKGAEIEFRDAAQKIQDKLTPWVHHDFNMKTMHQFRILIKKTRYSLEAFGCPILPFHDLQDNLGRAHDLDILVRFVKATPAIKWDKELYYLKARKLAKPVVRFADQQLEKILYNSSFQ